MFASLEKGGWKAENLSAEDKLQRPPAGYNAEHPQVDLLKHKSFILHLNLDRKEMESEKALDLIIASYERMLPFKTFLHQALDQ